MSKSDSSTSSLTEVKDSAFVLPSNGYHDTSIEILQQANATGSIHHARFVSKNRDLFPLSFFTDKKGFIFSLHRVRKGSWSILEYPDAKIGLTYFAV